MPQGRVADVWVESPYDYPFRSASVGVLGVLMSIVMWQYSAPPLRLNGGMGLGELVVGVWLTGLIPLFGYCAVGGDIALMGSGSLHRVLVALTPGVLLATARQVIMNVPDVEADAAAGKRNLCVRIGSKAGRKVFAYGTLFSYASLWVATTAKVIPYKVAILQTVFTFPIALKLVAVSLSKNNSDQWLANSNVPFMASALRSLFQCMGLILGITLAVESPDLPPGIFNCGQCCCLL